MSAQRAADELHRRMADYGQAAGCPDVDAATEHGVRPAQARLSAPTADDVPRVTALEAENEGLRRELATVHEALRFARAQAERSAITLEQLTRALPAPQPNPPARRRWPWWRK